VDVQVESGGSIAVLAATEKQLSMDVGN